MSDFWTAERIETLRTFVAEGLSGGEIMKAMGAPSRNSVIGKANRLGLRFKNTKKVAIPKPSPPVLVAKVTVPKSVPLESDYIAMDPVDPVEAVEPPRAGLVAIMDLRIYHCRWPHDEGVSTLYCGRVTTKIGAPYCVEHNIRAHAGKKHRREPNYMPNRSGHNFSFAHAGADHE